MWLQTLAGELQITLTDGTVWLSIGQGLLIGLVCLLFGVWVSRFVGLLDEDSPAGEIVAVGLASGLLVLTSWWATIVSAGWTAFTPVAIGFLLALLLTLVRRWRQTRSNTSSAARSVNGEVDARQVIALGTRRTTPRRDFLLAILGGALFVMAVGLLYGSTLTQGPRDGVQPLEFMDEAYYSILGQDIAQTGTESTYSPAGFDSIEGLPRQTWYHWGETWITAAAITIFGTPSLDARHLIVLPWLLLATAGLTGTLVRRITGTTSRGAYLFGFLASLFLAPVPVLQAGHFSTWAVGMIFGITMYGLAAVAVLLAMYALVVLGKRRASFGLAVFAAAVAATILPAHVVIAALATLGIGSVWAVDIGRALIRTRRLPTVAPIWRETFVVTGVLLVTTLVWGSLTGHAIANAAPSPGVTPFNAAWREAVGSAFLGAGAFFAIAIAWFAARKEAGAEVPLYFGTTVLFVAGAVIWGARLGDFNTFHIFYGGIALFATPAAAIAVWSIWLRFRTTTYRRLALALLVIGVVQAEIGIGIGIGRLEKFGPGPLPPVNETVLATIRSLPPDAKLAYSCEPAEEQAFWVAQLLAIQAHTGRTVVPMCFEAEFFAKLLGVPLSATIQSPQFEAAPQHALYPTAESRPSAAEISAFLKANGIGYIYVDSMHPNSLLADTNPIATSGDTQVLEIP